MCAETEAEPVHVVEIKLSARLGRPRCPAWNTGCGGRQLNKTDGQPV